MDATHVQKMKDYWDKYGYGDQFGREMELGRDFEFRDGGKMCIRDRASREPRMSVYP